MMKGRILVTGGLGYIGSHTVVELQNAGYSVCIIDNLSNSDKRVLGWITDITGEEPMFEEVDCCNLSSLMKVFWKFSKLDGVIHFAANKFVGESVRDPLKYYSNNITSLVNVIKCMTVYKVRNLIFSSSCTVYGQPNKLPVTELTPIQVAQSPYGNTKQVCEELIRDSVTAYPGLNSVLLRYFNPIGAHASGLIGELPKGVPQNLLPYVTQVAAGKREVLNIFGNDYDTPDGTCIRDYINVCDLAKAHIKAFEYLEGKEDHFLDIFNIGTGFGVSTKKIVSEFKRVNGVSFNVNYTNRRPGDVGAICASANKAKRLLGWVPEVSLEDTLKSAWKWQLRLDELGIHY